MAAESLPGFCAGIINLLPFVPVADINRQMQALGDMELVREYIRQDSQEAFAILVERHVALVYSVALRQTGCGDAAGDVTQAVFILLAQKAAELKPETILPGWLHHAARLTACSHRRTEFRRLRREQEAFMEAQTNEPVNEAWPHIRPLLDDALGRLGEKDRDALALRFFEGREFAEVGLALGTSEDAAKMRVNRALDKLRKFFAKRGVASTSLVIAGAMSAHSVSAAPVGLAAAVTAVAAAKGAAAGTSTLTLVNGALKLMAWTKTKIIIVTSVIILLAAGTTTLGLKAYTAARSKAALAGMAGDWEGVLSVKQIQLRLVLKIFATNGNYGAVMDSLDQGAQDVPVARLSARPHFLHAEMPGLGAEYEATLSADGTELAGTLKQVGQTMPLTLKRTTTPDQPETALAPDDYTSRANSDLQGAWEGALKVGNAQLRLNLRIAEPVAGTFHAQFDSVDQGARNIPVTTVTYQFPAVHFEIASLNGVYEGTLGNRGREINGTWTQMGTKLPLTFRLAGTNSTAAAATALDYGSGNPFQIQGHWQGALKVGPTELHLVFHIGQQADGSYAASMDSPDQGAKDIPASSAQFETPNVRLEWQAIDGFYTAILKDGKLTGTWHQGKAAFPLKMERVK